MFVLPDELMETIELDSSSKFAYEYYNGAIDLYCVSSSYPSNEQCFDDSLNELIFG